LCAITLLEKIGVGAMMAESRRYSMHSTDGAQGTTETQQRKASLGAKFRNDYDKYSRHARWNYHSALTIRWFSAAAGLVAGFLGLTNVVSSAVVGGIAAAAGILLAFGRDLKFQEKANWHYRRAEGTAAFQSRLEYQLPESPTVDNIAAVAAAYDRFSGDMTKEWEDRLAADDTPRPGIGPPPAPAPGGGT
jgi:hypothetical protein